MSHSLHLGVAAVQMQIAQTDPTRPTAETGRVETRASSPAGRVRLREPPLAHMPASEWSLQASHFLHLLALASLASSCSALFIASCSSLTQSVRVLSAHPTRERTQTNPPPLPDFCFSFQFDSHTARAAANSALSSSSPSTNLVERWPNSELRASSEFCLVERTKSHQNQFDANLNAQLSSRKVNKMCDT